MTRNSEAALPVEKSNGGSATYAAWFGIAVALGLYCGHVLLFIRHVNDDAFITFRYSRFLAEGLGPYFNVGEHVEGYTNFLHMLLMSLVYFLGGEDAVPVAALWIGILCGAVSLILIPLLARRVATGIDDLDSSGSFLAGSLGACLISVFPGYAVNCTSGLETALFGLLTMLALYLGLAAMFDHRWRGSGILWGAVALTRPEGAAVFAVFWLCCAFSTFRSYGLPGLLRKNVRSLLLDGGFFTLIFSSHLLFRFFTYDGELLPNTFHAKAEGFLGVSPWEYIRQGVFSPFGGYVGVAACIVGLLIGGRRLGKVLPLLGVSCFGAILPFIVGGDWMPGWRFSIPYLAPIAVVIAVGWIRLAGSLSKRYVRTSYVCAASLVLLMAFLHHNERLYLTNMINIRALGYANGHRALAEWIRHDVGKPGDTVALMDIGIVGYYCSEQRILDFTGLTDRFIAKSPGPLLAKKYDPGYVFDQEPDILVIVLSAYGDPSSPLPDTAVLGTWVGIEAEFMRHPSFERRYSRPRIPDRLEADWLQRTADRVGADRVFEHSYPGQYYLLAAFLLKDDPEGGHQE